MRQARYLPHRSIAGRSALSLALMMATACAQDTVVRDNEAAGLPAHDAETVPADAPPAVVAAADDGNSSSERSAPSDTSPKSDAGNDSDAITDSAGDTDADWAAESEGDPDADWDTDADANTDADAATDSGADTEFTASATSESQALDPLTARGQQLFAKSCAICHGDQGDGQGRFAYLMNPRPRDFQNEPFKLATTESRIPSDADLERTISRGMPGSAMPPWGHLPPSDLEALVKYVRHIGIEATRAELLERVEEGDLEPEEVAEEVAERHEPVPPLAVPPEPAFDDLRWFRGQRIYVEACAACHGRDGHPVAEAVKFDEKGYPVPPRSFVNGIFKGGSEGHQLYARIVKGMPGTPMPSSEGIYTDDENWDLIHYVQSLSRDGAQERAQLRMRTVVAPNVHGPLPDNPLAEEWNQARPEYVALTPLWWSEERIEGLQVQAMHNQRDLAIRLTWFDPTPDTRAVAQQEFRDGVAIQFSLTPDPPFYMGDPSEHGGVNIWYWKADRHHDVAENHQDVEDAFPNMVTDRYAPDPRIMSGRAHASPVNVEDHPQAYLMYLTARAVGNLVASNQLDTAVECLVAHGPGTLSAKPANVQLVEGKAVFERGVWYVQMQRAMQFDETHDHDDDGERVFRPGDYLPFSFAIWNGSAGDRDGKKNISIWQKLVIE